MTRDEFRVWAYVGVGTDQSALLIDGDVSRQLRTTQACRWGHEIGQTSATKPLTRRSSERCRQKTKVRFEIIRQNYAELTTRRFGTHPVFHVEEVPFRTLEMGRPERALEFLTHEHRLPGGPAHVVGLTGSLDASARNGVWFFGCNGDIGAGRPGHVRMHTLVQLIREHSARLTLKVVGPEVTYVHPVYTSGQGGERRQSEISVRIRLLREVQRDRGESV